MSVAYKSRLLRPICRVLSILRMHNHKFQIKILTLDFNITDEHESGLKTQSFDQYLTGINMIHSVLQELFLSKPVNKF